MKICELCDELARIYCESDQANLCWDCDSKVHSANFLVARHSRSLLCHVCHSSTSWTAVGEKIGRTVSVCHRCVNDEETSTEVDEEEDNDEEEIDLEDYQVVPWSSTLPPQPESSSSSDESLNGYKSSSLKRMRDDDDDIGTVTSHREVSALPMADECGGDDAAAACVESISTRMRKPLKIQRTERARVGLKLQIRCFC